MEQTVVIDVAGRVTIGPDAKMRDAISEALAAGARNIVMNMGLVSKLDSSGIGELVVGHTSVKKQGGRFILVGLSARLAATLQITQLLGVLESFDDMEAALESLGETGSG
jgi:anti-sigma B factor antagonist